MTRTFEPHQIVISEYAIAVIAPQHDNRWHFWITGTSFSPSSAEARILKSPYEAKDLAEALILIHKYNAFNTEKWGLYPASYRIQILGRVRSGGCESWVELNMLTLEWIEVPVIPLEDTISNSNQYFPPSSERNERFSTGD